ncbi:putative metal dependent phosphohydrolase [Aeromonas phage 65]|uniref:Guanosine-3',5'-bis(Diphosphate) 3'-pyrophosphohydrolase n=2 Tax=Ishigurovirus osborne TaxID=260149 RepID=A0A219YCL1_9CAUD|nr:metal-dependent phosphohydrolase [Aeromonas phage 65]ADQ53396.1 putative metal dependent phosphohydrolase [Aeromonas phage 65]APU01754.1 guanosine-3',5'-bis(Diphosphate) 3'-pyrophosphohydrolase [Aeromonas phage 65.2]
MSKKQAKMTSVAYALAANAFDGVFDRGGRPYFEHCLEVCRKLGPKASDKLKQVAILHDYLEDVQGATRDDLIDMGFSPDVVESIVRLTKVHGKDYKDPDVYEEYLQGIEDNRMACLVKMCDFRHNSDLRRLKGVTEKDMKRSFKYQEGYYRLVNVANLWGWSSEQKEM